MKRKEFLKVFGLASTGVLLPEVSSAKGSPEAFHMRDVKVYDNYLKGIQYYDFSKIFKDIKVGNELEIERFPNHKFDKFAVGIRRGENFLGYIPAYENIVLANLLDAGVPLYAKITTLDSYRSVGVGIWVSLVTTQHESIEPLTNQPADDVEDWYRR
ncbi:HIRAN domain-containing protein [Belliella kenyensis]|uniref:HIRAN domain-containing protein n=1 Tax=Belliella kenyensis TaxID=1472724 RepID=A0ABV8EK45_9BACT|nr:HIRAN domain-containing protein [Belliella kenyensis]MCH7400292.1 HIRAN domain-containing protein [Belliella kenyensis]MDN3604690.1 HIRAN domain-containing protein [Belliella kenyensis]MDN3605272.1 HIRAN domain-containing protein [Belliella kenyensis]